MIQDRPFQIGIFVQDLEAAMTQVGSALGLTWSDIRDRELDDGGHLRVVFSHQGPPHIELIEGPPGSAWDASAGPRIDHLGYWSDDFAADRDRLERDGVPEIRGDHRRTHHQTAHGFRIELFDDRTRDGFYEQWRIGHRAPD